MMHKCYSVSRSPIDENNDTVSKIWIVYRHGIVAKYRRRRCSQKYMRGARVVENAATINMLLRRK